MFVKDRQSQSLIKVIETDALFNPTHSTVEGRPQQGEEEQPAQAFDKAKLIFPSGEPLPQCWIDPDYQI